MMKRIAVLVVLLLGATLASAQNHHGPYVGGYLASGNGDAHWDIAGGGKVEHSISGGLGGVQGGFNWQRPGWFFGAQADFGVGELDGASRCPPPTFQCKTQLHSLATVRGRTGPVIGPVLLYATAGVATGSVRASIDNAAGIHDSESRTHIGWAGGLGIGLRASPRIQLQAEYLHVDFASEEYKLQNVSNKIKLSANFARLGIHYRFF